MVMNRMYSLKNEQPDLSSVANFGELWFTHYETIEGSCTVQVNFNLPTYFISLIIDHVSVLIYSFSHIYTVYIYIYMCVYVYTGCFTTLGHNCRR